MLRADVAARAGLVGETRWSSCLGGGGAKVDTVEHRMSALAGLGVDNGYVDLDGPAPDLSHVQGITEVDTTPEGIRAQLSGQPGPLLQVAGPRARSRAAAVRDADR